MTNYFLAFQSIPLLHQKIGHHKLFKLVNRLNTLSRDHMFKPELGLRESLTAQSSNYCLTVTADPAYQNVQKPFLVQSFKETLQYCDERRKFTSVSHSVSQSVNQS